MDIRYKLYPYPMLAADMDDYIDSSFTFTVTTEKEIREIKFGFQLDLRNDGLFNMIQSGKAEYLVRRPATAMLSRHQTLAVFTVSRNEI